MSDITEDLFTLLDNATPASTRVFPLVAPQPVTDSSYPFITYQCIASPVENVLAGNGGPPINQTRVQIDCFDLTYAGAVALAKAVVAAMQGWSTQNIAINSPEDFYEDVIRAYRRMIEFSIWHYD